jgi:hypothetical protein
MESVAAQLIKKLKNLLVRPPVHGNLQSIRKEVAKVLCEDLGDDLMSNNCVDLGILTAADRVFRRVFGDMDPFWIRWSYYIIKNVFNGDYVKEDEWAKNNCK